MTTNKRRTNRRASRNPSATRRFPISLVMIVRDEEAVLARCLESVRGLADEVVIVDTGSSDATVSIAERYGAKVGHFTWSDDFAAARNHALSLATHPWRLVLDADEWIVDRDQAKAALDAARRTVPNYTGLIEMRQTSDATRELRDTLPFPLPRLLPRQVGYTGRVHEQLTPQLSMQAIGLLVGHDGYTAEANARKDGRNIRLLEAAIGEDPANPYLWFQLGSDHFSHTRFEECLPYLVNAYNMTHPQGQHRASHDPRHWWHLLTVRLLVALNILERFEEAVALGEQEADAWADSSDFFYVFGTAVHGLASSVVGTDGARADELLAAATGCWIQAVELGDNQLYSGGLTERASVLAARSLVTLYRIQNRPSDAARYEAIVHGVERVPTGHG